MLSRLLENAFLITDTLETHTYVSFYRRLFSIYHQDIKMINENNQASKTLSTKTHDISPSLAIRHFASQDEV